MARHTAFRLTLDPSPAQAQALARHAGARRFAWNQCLALVKGALEARAAGAEVEVPWTGFSLINAFNAWKRSPAAGLDGGTPGLPWRSEVCNQVFEEAAVDLGKALAAFSGSRRGEHRGKRVGFPRFKKKGRAREAFRVRNKSGGVRVGGARPRSLTLPGIGAVRVREDTRRLRRLLRPGPDRKPRARVLSVTITSRAGRWVASVVVEAPDLHRGLRHPRREQGDHGGFVGLDRGLSAFVVGARERGPELVRAPAPKPLAASLSGLARASRAHSRTRPDSRRRRRAADRLARLHGRVADQRRHFSHQLSSRLVKTHDRLAIEDLSTAALMANRRLSRAIADAGWAGFATKLAYKADWYGAQLVVAPRTYPSTKRCSRCGVVKENMSLSQRTFSCEGEGCGYEADRDLNAARNLAAWARASCEAASRAVAAKRTETQNARGGEGTGRRETGGGTGPCEAGTVLPAR